jgi:hypothetical protein
MMVGIASGTYSSIFIAAPVLTAWKERETGYTRRRERIAELEGGVPAFADEIEMAKLGGDREVEEGAPVAEALPEPTPPAGAVATAEPATDGDGAAPAVEDPAAAERRERNERRRQRRQQRRKHGRNR